MKRIIFAALALLGAMALPAQAGHVGVSIGVGVPWPGYHYGPGWANPYYAPYAPYGAYGPYGPYYPGYAGYPAPVVVQQAAPVVVQPAAVPYVERPPVAQAQAAQDDSWYFCEKEKAYYPYVKQCAAGWVRVPARPAQ